MTQQEFESQSLGELVSRLADETRTLVKKEVDLVKVESLGKARSVLREAVVIVTGLAVAAGGALAILAAVILLLATTMDPWAAAFLVGAVVATVGVATTIIGVRALGRVDAVPRATLQTLKEDKLWLRHELSR